MTCRPNPCAGHRYPAEIISHAVWLYFRFPLSLRMVEEMLAARGIDVSHETVRQWARKFGQSFANQIRRRLPCAGDKWHLDEDHRQARQLQRCQGRRDALGRAPEAQRFCMGTSMSRFEFSGSVPPGLLGGTTVTS